MGRKVLGVLSTAECRTKSSHFNKTTPSYKNISPLWGHPPYKITPLTRRPAIHSPVIVHDSIQPVRYGQYCAAFKLWAQWGLDHAVCLHINGCGGFIHHQYLGLPQQGPGQADQLTLANAASLQHKIQDLTNYSYTMDKPVLCVCVCV